MQRIREMSNASRCLAVAERYAKLADGAPSLEVRRACRRLTRLYMEMATVAETFDRRGDESAKERIFALSDEVGVLRKRAG